MKIRKKTFAGVIFAVAFVMMVGISALALWTNDVISLDMRFVLECVRNRSLNC